MSNHFPDEELPKVIDHVINTPRPAISRAINIPVPDFEAEAARLKENKEFTFGFANVLAKQIYEKLSAFDSSLGNEYETGVKLVQYGERLQFIIESVGYDDPYLINFSGHLVDGSPIEVCQHVSQISFALIRQVRPEPETPKNPIGFR